MQTSPAGQAFIRVNEGFTAIPKPDNGKLEWGYGHDQQPGEIAPASINLIEAITLLQDDLASRFDPALNMMVPTLIPESCTQDQWDALADMAYNDGPRDVAIMLGHGWDQVPQQLPRWCYETVNGTPVKSPGLLARRLREAALFRGLHT
jgi:GH24 family phage-related lysozyme (muramidase)